MCYTTKNPYHILELVTKKGSCGGACKEARVLCQKYDGFLILGCFVYGYACVYDDDDDEYIYVL